MVSHWPFWGFRVGNSIFPLCAAVRRNLGRNDLAAPSEPCTGGGGADGSINIFVIKKEIATRFHQKSGSSFY